VTTAAGSELALPREDTESPRSLDVQHAYRPPAVDVLPTMLPTGVRVIRSTANAWTGTPLGRPSSLGTINGGTRVTSRARDVISVERVVTHVDG
jgi:hypothetical protein